jgi:hypothetical protein
VQEPVFAETEIDFGKSWAAMPAATRPDVPTGPATAAPVQPITRASTHFEFSSPREAQGVIFEHGRHQEIQCDDIGSI